MRRSIENLTARLALYEAHSQRVEGCFVHTHAGHRTEVTRLLPERGGRLTTSRKRSRSRAQRQLFLPIGDSYFCRSPPG